MGKGRRYRYRFYKKKGKWSANINTVNNQVIPFGSGGSTYWTYDLCSNPAQNSTTVSQQYTVKNVYFNFQFESSTDTFDINCLTGYIMYVPQGMTVDTNYPKYHPEYIMAMRFYGSPEPIGTDLQTTKQGIRNPLSIKSRLARRLQTGDKIIFLLVGTNSTSQTLTLYCNGVIRWWTKAN